MIPRICIAPLGKVSPELIDAVARRVADVMTRNVEVVHPDVDVRLAFDETRRQYHSTDLIAELLRVFPEGGGKILGVTSRDLFIPVLTYVFGEAQLGGVAAVASTHRLHNEYYGLPASHVLLVDRLRKECLHELGHTMGLVHCADYRCIMYSSTSVEEIDIKGEGFCDACRILIDATGELPSGPGSGPVR